MTETIRLAKESSMLTKVYNTDAKLFWRQGTSTRALLNVVTIDVDSGAIGKRNSPSVPIDDLVAEWEQNPGMRELIARGRQRLAEVDPDAKGETLRTIRLRKGISQRALANTIGTSQSHIARIEADSCDPLYSTVQRIAEALEIDMNTVDSAIRCRSQANRVREE